MIEKLVHLFIQFIDFFCPGFIIAEWQQGLVLRFGRFHRQVGPGFHWKIPFAVERVLSDDIKPRTRVNGIQSLTSSDGIPVAINSTIRYGIEDLQKFILENEDGDNVVWDLATLGISMLVAASTWDEIKSPQFEQKVFRSIGPLIQRETGALVLTLGLRDKTTAPSIRLWGDKHASS